MNEEEIINNIRDSITDNENIYLLCDSLEDIIKNNNKQYDIQLIVTGLLDLYNKEKEKNKELENADLTTVYMNGFYDGEKTWKDKIRDKITFYKRYGKIKNSDEDVMSVEIEVLQELLEERN